MKHLRERLEQNGAQKLSTTELLTLVLRTSPANEEIVQKIEHLLTTSTGLADLLNLDFGHLAYVHSFGKAKAAQLQAVFELARRLNAPSGGKQQIRCSADALRVVHSELAYLDHEELRLLVLDTKNQVVANLLMYQGTVNSSVLRIAELFRPAIVRNCPHILVCHNHPSGDPTPSPEDLEVTRQLVEAGKLLDIEVLDHLIIGSQRYHSLKESLKW